ncbi:MAG: DUF4139 domain-containing protein, partial [Bacteroidota bacterium]
MKNFILLFTFVFSAISFFAQKETITEITPDISSLVIYTEGVEVSHKVPVKLTAGRNLLIFKGLSSKLEAKSLRVNIDNEVSVLAVSHKTDYLAKNPEKPRLKQVKDSLVILNSKMQSLNDELNAYAVQREMLMKNQSLAGQNTGLNSLELQKAADFFQSRIFEINKRTSQLNIEITQLTPEINAMNNELYELNVKCYFQQSEISVLVYVEKDVQYPLDLRYYVRDAGWVPYYEIKADEIDKPLDLIFRAKVFNDTDIDWVNANITLSTADPNKSANYPNMTPWKLNYYGDNSSYNSDYQYKYENQMQAQTNLNDNYYFRQDEQMKNVKAKGKVNYTTISVSELSIELSVKTKYSIPSNAKPYIVDITEYRLPAKYKHISVPKLDRDVYIMAQITDWEDLNLIEGEANVYFDDTYVGKSYIYTRDVDDTLNLSLGRDKKVMITRSKVKDYTSKQLIGLKRKETY